MEINHKFRYIKGYFDTKDGQLIAVRKQKYNEVHLCFKANMNVPFAKIVLYFSDSLTYAKATENDAYTLAKEIVRRFNEFPENDKK